MIAILKKINDSFLEELKIKGDYWRILRVETIIDLIKLELIYFKKNGEQKHLFKVLTYLIKIKLLNLLPSIVLLNNIDETYKQFNNDFGLISNKLTIVLKEFSVIWTENKNVTFIDIENDVYLFRNVDYNFPSSTIDKFVCDLINFINK